MNWDGWVGSADGRPTFFKRRLAGILGWTVRLHKFIAPDDPGCWHTHPAHAVRVVLWGGYIEETPDGRLRAWLPGMVGRIRPEFAHRVAGIQNGRASYSLWFHGPKVARIALVGQCAEGEFISPDRIRIPAVESGERMHGEKP